LAGDRSGATGIPVVENEEAKANAIALKSKGKFILGSNELDEEKLPAEMILTAYRGNCRKLQRKLLMYC
jgi:hypothetical protein